MRTWRVLAKTVTYVTTTSETTVIILDEGAHEDIKVCKYLQIDSIIISYYLQTIASEEFKFLDDQPKDSFKYILWQQELEAAKKKDACAMRWHPLKIRLKTYRGNKNLRQLRKKMLVPCDGTH